MGVSAKPASAAQVPVKGVRLFYHLFSMTMIVTFD
jgi:hypothetical protein